MLNKQKKFVESKRKDGIEKNSIIADPLFEDVANANFKLKPESPALKLGFKQIDMSKIGLKTDEFPKKYMKYNLQDVDGRKPNFHRNRAGQKRYDFW